jgi:hypothetical protein
VAIAIKVIRDLGLDTALQNTKGLTASLDHLPSSGAKTLHNAGEGGGKVQSSKFKVQKQLFAFCILHFSLKP